jgi:hypothetical protein
MVGQMPEAVQVSQTSEEWLKDRLGAKRAERYGGLDKLDLRLDIFTHYSHKSWRHEAWPTNTVNYAIGTIAVNCGSVRPIGSTVLEEASGTFAHY